MKCNFVVFKKENICLGVGKSFDKLQVHCLNCKNYFPMYAITNFKEDETTTKYEYKYCPHCANKLVDEEME